jgi:hypothetical protein
MSLNYQMVEAADLARAYGVSRKTLYVYLRG